jgi:hypothetical protein
MAVLLVPYEVQERLERHFKTTMFIVRNHWKNPGHVELNYLDTGPEQRQLAVAAFAYRRSALSSHRTKIQEVMAQVFDGVKADKLLFIGVDVEGDEHPWDDLVIAYRPTNGVAEASASTVRGPRQT